MGVQGPCGGAFRSQLRAREIRRRKCDENECKPTKRTTLESRSVAPGFGAQCATRVGDYVKTRGAGPSISGFCADAPCTRERSRGTRVRWGKRDRPSVTIHVTHVFEESLENSVCGVYVPCVDVRSVLAFRENLRSFCISGRCRMSPCRVRHGWGQGVTVNGQGAQHERLGHVVYVGKVVKSIHPQSFASCFIDIVTVVSSLFVPPPRGGAHLWARPRPASRDRIDPPRCPGAMWPALPPGCPSYGTRALCSRDSAPRIRRRNRKMRGSHA